MTNKEIYQRCLAIVDSDQPILIVYTRYTCKEVGICDLLSHFRPGNIEIDFPEWFRQNPHSDDDPYGYWWPIEDRESRRLALLEAIKLCDNVPFHP